MDALLSVDGASLSISRRASVEVGGVISNQTTPTTTLEAHQAPPKPSAKPNNALTAGKETGKTRRSSVTPLQSSLLVRDEWDETMVEDVETTDAFQVYTTLVPGGSHGNHGMSGRVDVSESVSPPRQSSQGGDCVVVPAPHHTSPGPGPLHLAAKYVI